MRRGRVFLVAQIRKRKKVMSIIAVLLFAVATALPLASGLMEPLQEAEVAADEAEAAAAVESPQSGGSMAAPQGKVLPEEPGNSAGATPTQAPVPEAADASSEYVSAAEITTSPIETGPRPTISTADPTAAPTVPLPTTSADVPGVAGPYPTISVADPTAVSTYPVPNPTVSFPSPTPVPTYVVPNPTIGIPAATAAPTYQVPNPTVSVQTASPAPTYNVPQPTVSVTDPWSAPTLERPRPTLSAAAGSLDDSGSSGGSAGLRPQSKSSRKPEESAGNALLKASGTPSPSTGASAAPKTDDRFSLLLWSSAFLAGAGIILIVTIKTDPEKNAR